MKNQLLEAIETALCIQMQSIEKNLEADLLCFNAEIHPDLLADFRDCVELLKSNSIRKRLAVMLRTIGGNVVATEKMVEIIRYHYDEVYFIVPDWANSAGTILCMSGDKIYMDYFSSLGPVDPQVLKNGNWFSSLGYLDKVNELIQKSLEQTLSAAEMVALQQLDLSEIRGYELSKELGVALISEWLVKYLIKDWAKHFPNKSEITEQDKSVKATEIANILSDNKYWLCHGRTIGVNKLKNIVGIPVEDYSTDIILQSSIRKCNNLINQYIEMRKPMFFLHSQYSIL